MNNSKNGPNIKKKITRKFFDWKSVSVRDLVWKELTVYVDSLGTSQAKFIERCPESFPRDMYAAITLKQVSQAIGYLYEWLEGHGLTVDS